MSERHMLLLRNREFRQAIRSFLKRLEEDELLQRAFIENPAQATVTKLLPEDLRVFSSRNISDANRLLFSVLANDAFCRWLGEYQDKLRPRIKDDPDSVDRAAITRDLAEALTRYADPAIMTALIGQTGAANKPGGTQEVPLPPDDLYLLHSTFIASYIYAVGVVAVVGIVFGVVLAVEPASEMKITSPQLRGVAERMVEHAKMLAERGDLTDIDKDLG